LPFDGKVESGGIVGVMAGGLVLVGFGEGETTEVGSSLFDAMGVFVAMMAGAIGLQEAIKILIEPNNTSKIDPAIFIS
jgi:hypothetical protein